MSDAMPDGGSEGATPDLPDATSALPPGHPLADTQPAPAGDEGDNALETLRKQLADVTAELEKTKGHARKHEAQSKANSAAAKELQTLREQSMSETEKAVAEARRAGRDEALAEINGRLVMAQLRAAAATAKVDTKVINAVLARLDTAAFINDDGNVDDEAITAFVDSIAPPPPTGDESKDPRWPDLGQGQHGTPPLNASGLERALTQAVNRA